MEKKTPFIIKILFLMPVLLGVLCTVPKKQILPDVSLTTTVRDSVVTDSIRKSHTITHDTLPKTIQIQDWVNKDFVVLPKQQMFRVHGYEIYFSKNLDKATSSPDTTLELKNHRIKSEKLSNHLITCVLVERAGAEWLLECYDSLLNRSLYMVSYKGAFKDLLYKDDLEQASLRW